MEKVLKVLILIYFRVDLSSIVHKIDVHIYSLSFLSKIKDKLHKNQTLYNLDHSLNLAYNVLSSYAFNLMSLLTHYTDLYSILLHNIAELTNQTQDMSNHSLN